MKKSIFICLLSIVSILALALLVFGGLIHTYTDVYLPLGARLVLPVLEAAVYLCEAILLFVGISRLLYKFKHPHVLSGVIVLALTTVLLVVPSTKAFGTLNYKINYEMRNQFAETFNENVQDFTQVDVYTYLVKDVRLSYTGTAVADFKEDATKIMFYVSEGVCGSGVLVYSSDGTDITDNDFNNGLPSGFSFEFKNVVKLDDNWTFAVVD